ncbi:unnamed protein product [Kuraishia capsulata CBS 1993]|uniref:Profilin n=1 Tax=Kuraishia capsulata CBS 1993 TaxID=1382522 RepID=W6MRY1_9ASCO|nr:uncharacterized protein KUCA_T00005457001 [Kuraishia capsulata CBS 1993]CDK29469.1 unnamed protein product [Kuraishia capsulata CBS 1993]
MSWQAYTDNLVGTGKIDRAAIYGAAGDSQWATTNALTLGGNEIAELVKGFADASQLQTSGLHIQGQKYFLIRADPRSIYGKHTKQAILIGHYPTGVQAGEATKIVEQLADYLIGVGY